jgi:hypothetical protein
MKTTDRSYYDPDLACVPCRGTGWLAQEDASGAPNTQVTCPYCQGKGTTWWVAPNRLKRLVRPRVWTTAVAVWLTYSLFPAHHFLLHMALLVPVVAFLALTWKRPSLWPSLPRRQHAPGFTDNREKTALGIFAAVVAARSLFGSRNQQRGF